MQMLRSIKASLDDVSLWTKGIAVVSIPLIALVGTLVLTAWFEHESASAQARINHTLGVQAAIYQIRTLTTEGETGVRGYLLFGSSKYLEPYYQARTKLGPAIDHLKTLVEDSETQTSSTVEVERLATLKMQALSDMLSHRERNLSSDSELAIRSYGSMDKLRRVIVEMEDTEERLLDERIKKYDQVLNQTNTMLAVLFVIALLSGIAASYVVISSILSRVNQLEAYARKVSRGQTATWEDSGEDEIGQLGRNVEIMTRNLLNRELALQNARVRLEEANQNLKAMLVETRAANQELESFSYSVSHDLRAPLRHVAGFSELMMRNSENLDARNLRYLDIISTSIKQMGVLIDELLAFSRMGRTSIKTDPIDLNIVINDVLTGLSPEITERNIDWDIDLLPTIEGDRTMIHLVFQNLIGNALKYSRNRDPAKISIKAIHLEQEEMERITVKDNGIGFDMTYVGKLFGVFQRLHSSDEYEGTGIGLASVRRIVNRHGGQVEARGEVNAGAEFTVTLPTRRKQSYVQTA